VDRTLLLELEAELEGNACSTPDGPGEVARTVSALRLATPGAIAAGPVIFERLDWRPYGIQPVPPVAAQVPPGEPTRLDPLRVRGGCGPSGARRDAPPRLARGAGRGARRGASGPAPAAAGDRCPARRNWLTSGRRCVRVASAHSGGGSDPGLGLFPASTHSRH